ncbi:Bug family tripartite tricarboxylate transporter substrate binding protein [Sabulicella glaciei]|uniref:Tripartite tricarboxylate transporter substrate binding protein n=1 Tax=Sabulicella glaciei TaxID=2984948 RepID=A0ABT3NU41_9PROT|nr:tripartite tricarboxylate transporter substrate binding protein [Roseococcus sp. MDT2-1-1]MCW8085669.1 tripartite tricarboxylate transporter substrate binding protein [Roseococcus sp. MDT2-1-1]
MRKRLLPLLAACLLPAFAAAQGFPDRPPRILGGFAAGGTSDIVNRILAESAAQTLGQRPVVEVRTGANGFIAAAEAARSAPDGHTIVQCSTGMLTISPELPGVQTPIDPARDLQPIANFAHSTQVMAVTANSPHRTVAGFLDAARGRPGTLTYASAGIGSVSHLSGARLEQMARVPLVHVPFRGAAPGVLDVMAGRVDTIITNLGDVAQQVRGGEMRLLAFADGIGMDGFPGVGQIGDTVPGYAVSGWFGYCAPRGTPEPVVARWADAIRAATEDAATRQRLLQSGLVPRFEDPARFSQTIAADRAAWGAVIRSGNIRAE